MKRTTFFSVLFVALLAANSVAAQSVTKATITDATVFLNGAQLTHKAQLSLQKGDNEIVIEGLAPSITQQSLQVSLTGGAVITSYNYSVNYLSSDNKEERVAELQKSLDDAKAQLQAIADQITVTQQMLKLLQDGVNHSLTVDRQNITTETIEKNIAYYEKRSEALMQQLTQLKVEQTTQQKKVNSLQQQLNQEKNSNGNRSGVLTMNINAPRALKTNAEIKYFTYAANWQPSYELNIKTINSPISLLMRASVRQTTGLDWNNVRLTLSSGAPSTNNQVPDITTWFVHKYEPQPVRYKTAATNSRANMVGASMVMEEAAMDMIEYDLEEAYTPTVSEYVTTSQQQTAVEYAIELPYNVEGNGKALTIALLEKTLNDVEYEYYTAPAKQETTFLTAKIRNWEQQNLLDGQAMITYNGTFYGTTTLTSTTVDNFIKLTLGEDTKVVVNRERTAESTETKVIGKEKVVTYVYKTTIRNTKAEVVNLSVQDIYPVSTDKQIKIELLDKTTTPTVNNTEKGLLTYNLTLQPNETKEIVLAFTIKYPKDITIVW